MNADDLERATFLNSNTLLSPQISALIEKHPGPWSIEMVESSRGDQVTVIANFSIQDAKSQVVVNFPASIAILEVLCVMVAAFNDRCEAGRETNSLNRQDKRALDLLNLSIGRIDRAIRLAEGEFAEAPEGSVARNYMQGVRNGLAEAQLAIIKDAKLLETKQ